MHSIIKNLSKVLALTTMISSFAILPGVKASGTEPENIPQLQNGRSETQVPTAEMINTAIAELNSRLGGDHVVECSDEFLRDREVAYKILQELISCFERPAFTDKCKEKFIKSDKKLHLKSLSEASDTLVLWCLWGRREVNAFIIIGDTITRNVTDPEITRHVTVYDITPNAITMFFSWDCNCAASTSPIGCVCLACPNHGCVCWDCVSRLTNHAFKCFLEFFEDPTRQPAVDWSGSLWTICTYTTPTNCLRLFDSSKPILS